MPTHDKSFQLSKCGIYMYAQPRTVISIITINFCLGNIKMLLLVQTFFENLRLNFVMQCIAVHCILNTVRGGSI